MIDPDAGRRARATAQARAFIERIPELGAQVATLCTGTRDRSDIWRGHPGQRRARAPGTDLRASLAELLPAARAAGVRLGIEPEPANVVTSAVAPAGCCTNWAATPGWLGIVLDPANLVQVPTAHGSSATS